jgi:hypothetical protein
MSKKFRSIRNKLIVNPKRLFLIDSSGAFLTAFLLGIILTRLEEDFGMPRKIVKPLSVVACIYSIYSICCYFFAGRNWRPFLKVIAIANLLYCFITIASVILFYQALTILGVTYFLGEIIIIGCLVCIELLSISKSNEWDFANVTIKQF